MPFITARVVSIVRADVIQALAFAGPNQSVLCAAVVQLEGTITGDDIANHTFEWVQTLGTPVTLINPNTLTPSFVNPQVSDIEFTLYVDKNTPFEDSDSVFISRGPESFVTAWGGNESGNLQGMGATTQGLSSASNTIGTNNEFYLNAYVGGWSYLNPPEARFSPIFTPDDLDRVRRNLSGSYWLMNDIDLSRWGNWEPIGTRGRPFSGELQGNGFKIENMSITSSSKDAGLFSAIGNGALIETVGVTNANISGVGSSVYKSILAGTAQNTLGTDGGTVTIRNCYTEGTIASGGNRAGGLIGHTGSNANSVYENTYADVTVTGGGADAGGWTGTFSGTPTYVENYGNTTKTAAVVGTGAPGGTEVEGRTTDQLRVRSLYEQWDFIDTWELPQPYFGNVVLLLEFEGNDGDTTTTDASESARTVTLNGTTQLDDAQKKFGNTSLLIGSSKSSVGGSITDWQFAADEDFTLEMFVRFNGDPGTADTPFLATWHSPNNICILWRLNNNLMELHLGNGSTGLGTASAAWNPDGDRWYHIAVCTKRGTTDTTYLFADGNLLGTSTALDGVTNVNGLTYFPLALGSYWNGAVISTGDWFDSIRIVKGEALYTEAFTPPTGPHSTTIDPSAVSAALRISRPHEAAPATRGACDDQWEIRWSEPTDIGPRTLPPTYVYKGVIVEETISGQWTNPRYIPRERNTALMTPDMQHRITTVWEQYIDKSSHTIRENSRTLGNRQFTPTKEVQIVNPGIYASRNTSSRVGPYAVDRFSAWGGSGTSTATTNLVITIQNPSIIFKAEQDLSTLGIGGGVTGATVSTLNRYTLITKLPPDTQDTGTLGLGGNGQSTHADIEGMTVTRLSGISIG